MNAWLAAAIGFILALAPPLWVAACGRIGNRLVAVQLASALATLAIVALTYAIGQPSFIDLALVLGLLSLPGTLLLAFFLERWL